MWKTIDSITYYTNKNFKCESTVAIFSFIGAIVKKVKHDSQNLEYICNSKIMIKKFKDINEKGASIILIDSFKTNNIDHIKKAIELFEIDIECPIISFISTASNKYSKPCTSIMNIVDIFYKTKNKLIDKSVSILVGDKAGRYINKVALDKNCIDRAFANNIGIQFTVPEIFFLNLHNYMWKWDNKILVNARRNSFVLANTKKPIIIDEIGLLPISDKYTILVTGPPSCGKQELANTIKKEWLAKFPRNNINVISGELSNLPFYKHSTIIHLNCIIKNINKIVRISMENKIPILIIEIIVKPAESKLLNFIKVQKSADINIKALSKLEWFEYYKQYISPIYNIQCIKHIEYPPNIPICKEYWYEYSN